MKDLNIRYNIGHCEKEHLNLNKAAAALERYCSKEILRRGF